MVNGIIHGIILAFGLILPLGVQNVFVFNQGATQPRFKRALPVVITASLCDTLLITLAVLGVSVLVLGNAGIKVALLSIGILFMIYMGYVTWRSKPSQQSIDGVAMTPKKQIGFAASVSLLNPHAILDTVGVIGTSSLSYTAEEKLAFTLACILVSWLWFFSLAFIGNKIGKLDKTGNIIFMLNKVSAIIMWGTAIYLLATLFL
ncbi:LysE/ArgO family amino acid transporter [Bacillus salitolerans]|uniref:LysE/ArgO family amino acid transporter n=1 Tax=Bacillus salitolerans TaxID=1437434 RepID=A0ABW4LYA3_9BACI